MGEGAPEGPSGRHPKPYRLAFAEAAEEVLRLRAWLEWMEIMTDPVDPESRAHVLARNALDGLWPPTWLEPHTRPPEDQPPIPPGDRERIGRALLGGDEGDR